MLVLVYGFGILASLFYYNSFTAKDVNSINYSEKIVISKEITEFVLIVAIFLNYRPRVWP